MTIKENNQKTQKKLLTICWATTIISFILILIGSKQKDSIYLLLIYISVILCILADFMFMYYYYKYQLNFYKKKKDKIYEITSFIIAIILLLFSNNMFHTTLFSILITAIWIFNIFIIMKSLMAHFAYNNSLFDNFYIKKEIKGLRIAILIMGIIITTLISNITTDVYKYLCENGIPSIDELVKSYAQDHDKLSILLSNCSLLLLIFPYIKITIRLLTEIAYSFIGYVTKTIPEQDANENSKI